MHGQGIVRLPDGKKIYDGEFKNGKMHGHGVVFLAGGIKYEGEIINNLMHG